MEHQAGMLNGYTVIQIIGKHGGQCYVLLFLMVMVAQLFLLNPDSLLKVGATVATKEPYARKAL
jgi:hypothetical protein